MENKEQLKSLIETAKLHGWKDPNKLNEILNESNSKFDGSSLYLGDVFINSLNNLIIDYDTNEISFLDALFTALLSEDCELVQMSKEFRKNYIEKPSKERFNYLVTRFESLIENKNKHHLQLLFIAAKVQGWKDEFNLEPFLHYNYFELDQEYNSVIDIEFGRLLSFDYLFNKVAKDETSFFEALCNRVKILDRKHFDKIVLEMTTHVGLSMPDLCKIQWNLLPSNKRIKWLFDTFNQIIKPNQPITLNPLIVEDEIIKNKKECVLQFYAKEVGFEFVHLINENTGSFYHTKRVYNLYENNTLYDFVYYFDSNKNIIAIKKYNDKNTHWEFIDKKVLDEDLNCFKKCH